MDTYSVDQFIGKTLTAKQQVVAHVGSPKSNEIFVIPKGANIGAVYSWVKDPDNAANVYWQFLTKDNKSFVVKHNPNFIGLNSQEKVKSVREMQEDAKRAESGNFVYYIEKWSPWAIGLVAASLGLKFYLGRNKK